MKKVVAKDKNNITIEQTIHLDTIPNTILGCWIINHQFNYVSKNGIMWLFGSLECNTWYSHENDTKTRVSTEKIEYEFDTNVKISEIDNVVLRCLKSPTVEKADIDKVKIDSINLVLNLEMGYELIQSEIEIIEEQEYEEIAPACGWIFCESDFNAKKTTEMFNALSQDFSYKINKLINQVNKISKYIADKEGNNANTTN